jgi:dTDP-4-amino-4,6-dideoxygalactose transaminase
MIPYGKQTIDQEDIDAVSEALKSEWLTTGPLVEIFENKLSQITGAPTICVSSGTAALHCAYSAIDLQKGDEIITTPITFIATQATAIMLGAKIVFADISPKTGNIDPNRVEELITRKTKAIVAVDYAGHPAEILELRRIADKYNLYLIEDAAHSIGSNFQDFPVGSIADITTFSFFPTKNLTTGEGGAISSKDLQLLNKAKLFARQGLIRNPSEFKLAFDGPWHQEVHHFGLNYRLPDILCALGISQLTKLQKSKLHKQKLFKQYKKNLQSYEQLLLPSQENYVDPNWHLFPIRVPSEKRLGIFNVLRSNGIGVQVNYIPAYWHPAFNREKYPFGLCPLAENFYRQEISLPMYYELKTSQVDFVCEILVKTLD